MTQPVVLSVTSQAFASSTSHVFNMPVTNNGDLLVALVSYPDAPTRNTPSGWLKDYDVSAGGLICGASYLKQADGTEGGTTVDFTTSIAKEGHITMFRFQAGTVHIDLSTLANMRAGGGTIAANTSDANPNPPSATPDASWSATSFDKYYLAWFTKDGNGTTSAFPTNYGVNQGSGRSSTSASTACNMAWAGRQATITSDNPSTFTTSNSTRWIAMTYCFRGGEAGGAQTLSAVGDIASANAFGTGLLNFNIFNIGNINSGQAFGDPTVFIAERIAPNSIASQESVSVPIVAPQVVPLVPSGIPTTEAFGNLTTRQQQYLLSQGIPSAQAFGSPFVKGETQIVDLNGGVGDGSGHPLGNTYGGTIENPLVIDDGSTLTITEDKATYRHVIVRDSTGAGIAVNADDVTLDNVTVENWNTNNNSGLGPFAAITSANGISRLKVVNSTIIGSLGRLTNGIWVKSTTALPSQGGHYIGYNYFEGCWDAIGSETESDDHGGYHNDTIIEWNVIVDGTDDGIQVEGRNENLTVRYNRIENCSIGIAFAASRVGPLYVHHNYIKDLACNQAGACYAVKMGSGGAGTIEFHNNIIYSPNIIAGFAQTIAADGLKQSNPILGSALTAYENVIMVSRYVYEITESPMPSNWDFFDNQLYTSDGTRFTKWGNVTYSNLTDHRNATGQEIGSTQGLVSDPGPYTEGQGIETSEAFGTPSIASPNFPFTDNFNRANGNFAAPWTNHQGQWTVDNNEAIDTASESTATVDVGVSNLKATVKLVTRGNDGGIILRFTDVNNYILVNSQGLSIRIWTKIGGTWTERSQVSCLEADGSTLEVLIDGTQIQAFVNGTPYGSYSTSFNQSATRFGLGDYSSSAPTRFDDFVLTNLPVTTLSPSGIPTGFTMGTHLLARGPVNVLPVGISSVQAFGVPKINLFIVPNGVPTAFAVGDHIVSVGVRIVNAEGFGIPTSFASGIPTLLTGPIDIAGIGNIPSAEAFGTPNFLDFIYNVGNIPSAEAFGLHELIPGIYTIHPEPILSRESIPAPRVIEIQHITDAGAIASLEEFGVPNLVQLISNLIGIMSAEVFGTPEVIPGPVDILAVGIPSAESMGTFKVIKHINATGIGSQEAFGQPLIIRLIAEVGLEFAGLSTAMSFEVYDVNGILVGAGPITRVFASDIAHRLDEIGEGSITMDIADEYYSLIQHGRTMRFIREGEGVVGTIVIDHVNKQGTA